ncbi:hypothetical protein HOH45_08105 [bacterium]|nr:hypothetical protein [bacterium]
MNNDIQPNQAKEIKKEDKKKVINVKVYEYGHVRVHNIDMHSGRDRQKLSYILTYEKHKLRAKDRELYETLLMKHKKGNKPHDLRFSPLHGMPNREMHQYSDKRFTS